MKIQKQGKSYSNKKVCKVTASNYLYSLLVFIFWIWGTAMIYGNFSMSLRTIMLPN